MMVEAVVPAYNEEARIGGVVEEVSDYVDRIVVVDDGSSDGTAGVARDAGADVIVQERNRGYLEALRTGFTNLEGEAVVTLDADGEMDPGFIPDLLRPIHEEKADLVLGKRDDVSRLSERFLSWLAGLRVDASDTGTGYRALDSGLAERMELSGVCPCGTFVLEARTLGAEILEVPIENRDIAKPRRIAWKHFVQFWHVLRALIFSWRERWVYC